MISQCIAWWEWFQVFDCDFVVFARLWCFLDLAVTDLLPWPFLFGIKGPSHSCVQTFKLLCEHQKISIVLVVESAVENDQLQVSVEVIFASVLASLQPQSDSLQVNWLFDYFMVVQNPIFDWVNWEAEGSRNQVLWKLSKYAIADSGEIRLSLFEVVWFIYWLLFQLYGILVGGLIRVLLSIFVVL